MIYISGAISGVENPQQKFLDAVDELIYLGWSSDEIVNPQVNDLICTPGKLSWKQYMDIDLMWLSYCDEIYMLCGWENSRGARLEYEYAKANGYKIIFQDNEKSS